MDATDNNSTNVIEVQFNKTSSISIPDEIAHPASKNYRLDDDPLDNLLHEFDDVIEDQLKLEMYEDYIHHLEEADDIKLNMEQTPAQMGEEVLDQLARLREDFKRMKFYLDELNLDD